MPLALAQGSRGPFGMQTEGFGTSMKAGQHLGEVKARPHVNRSRQHGKGNSGSGNSGPGNRGLVKSRSRNSGPGNSGSAYSAPGNSAPGSSGPGNSAPGNSSALENGSGEGANSRGLNSAEDSSTQSSQSKAGLFAIHSATVFPWAVFRIRKVVIRIRRSMLLITVPDILCFFFSLANKIR
jgi:hypothetical protein